jgi:hypothetical protein
MKYIEKDGDATGIKEMKYTYRILIVESEGRDHMEDVGVDGRIILKCGIVEVKLHYS